MNKNSNDFRDRVVYWVKQIPKGKTATYGEIATLAGSPGAARAVGSIMKNNKDKTCPCHRVIRADGKIGAYNGNLGKTKEELLKAEGAF